MLPREPDFQHVPIFSAQRHAQFLACRYSYEQPYSHLRVWTWIFFWAFAAADTRDLRLGRLQSLLHSVDQPAPHSLKETRILIREWAHCSLCSQIEIAELLELLQDDELTESHPLNKVTDHSLPRGVILYDDCV